MIICIHTCRSSADNSSWDITEAIFSAIVSGDMVEVRGCLDRGVDVNAKSAEVNTLFRCIYEDS